MIEWLIAWGGSEAVKFIAQEVIGELAKGTAEDYVKDFFKQGISDAIGGITNGKVLQKATAQAIKYFLDLIQQELENAELSESELKKYTKPLKKFIQNKSVLKVLVSAFDNELKILETNKLAITWNEINPPLPDEFDWELVAKQYQRKVKKIIRESDELRKILDSENLDNLANQTEIKPDFDLKRYREGIREQYGNLKLESLDTSGYAYNQLKLWRMFIPQNVRESQEFLPQVHEIPKEYRQRLKETGQFEEELSQERLESLRRRYFEQHTRSVLELIENSNYQYLVILGDPGSGKSTLLQYIALQWAELPLKDLPLQPIPILIELRTYVRNHDANKCQNFLEFLEKGSGIICQLPQQELHAKLQSGDAIVMFDGLDEVFDPAKREEIITDIHRFTNDYKNVRVIVTSRVIGYKPQKLRDAEFNHFMLQDLSAEQIEDFIQRWHNLTYIDEAEKIRKRERFKRAIKDSSAIKELAENPLLLTMMAILNRNQELPRDRAELYNQASRVLLHQWDMERALVDAKIDPITIDYKDKQAILRRVAHFMQGNTAGLAGNLILGDDLERIIWEYLKSVDINDARGVARALMEQLRSRNFILCFVGAEYYAFVHRTFLEYFCAREFVWQFEKEQKISKKELIEEVFGSHWQDETWHEVLRLISGMIDAKFVGEVISYLMEQEGEEEKFLNLFLAGKCLFEVRIRHGIGDVENRLLNRLKDLTGYNRGYSCRPYDIDSKEIYQKYEALIYKIRGQAVAVVAATWRDDPLTYTWLKQLLVSRNNWIVRREAVRQIATLDKDKLEILELLKQQVLSDDGWDVRREAVQQIATLGKGKPEILELFKQWVESNENWDVRVEAVRQIATGWKREPGTLDLLKQWVESGNSSSVRVEALRQIATGWKHEEGILDSLKQWVESDKNWDVRVEAVLQIATAWKHEPGILDSLKQSLESDNRSSVRLKVVLQIATDWKHEPGILDLLKQSLESDNDSGVRVKAVRQIATDWKNQPGILELLKQWVESDDSSSVRQEAVRQIVIGWKHEPEILDLLKLWVKSENSAVRSEAVRQIATGWKHEQGILELLKQRAKFDDYWFVRFEALRQIATGWKHEPGIFELLKQSLESDHSWHIRREAVRQIATGWKHEPGIFELFYHTTLNDFFQREYNYQDNPRQIALEEILEQYPDHPQILPLLQDRAENDPDEQLREWAKEILRRLEN
ncbi:MAG: NACHT domain-containing protein [Okeania sp. SIO3B5]|uniref:HEAT repeat domain-containing protein n=1 Tax=Okeania sp. SIO3B5 TaxID=2607811 RepID=UPI0013FF7A8C|nr:HEAT repeat domain-containing protein [Okeania sp. SIO3B5]NEO58621.1 NACHT domain-containing protein [Okeania sp. SIO3B5]